MANDRNISTPPGAVLVEWLFVAFPLPALDVLLAQSRVLRTAGPVRTA